jgi:NAD(P)H-hydrate repair Nnr-like enzyme with NAD(P)H-hydrate epimerase domain
MLRRVAWLVAIWAISVAALAAAALAMRLLMGMAGLAVAADAQPRHADGGGDLRVAVLVGAKVGLVVASSCSETPVRVSEGVAASF